MKLFRFASGGGPRLGIEDAQGARHDLTAASPEAFASVSSWLALPDPLGAVRDARARATAHPLPPDVPLLAPIDAQDVWAAGVTYERSRNARKEESAGGGDFYDRVYDAERPELFFKATPRLVVGPGAPVRIRRDSSWNVPEPELSLVVSAAGRIVGYTAGNDVSSRSIEGDNPLYLPQAKVYDGCCALGPAIALADEPGLDLRALSIQLVIRRKGEAVFAGETSTARMRRAPEELVAYLTRELSFPAGVVLMTGTGIVPPDSFTLEPGDVVEITIPGAGTLVNPVSQG
ncbi:fumarylacetoacetate hydrolase family protein [Sorangium sp. So ce321]|uniref:fumarylacetoacetate hydrolase family protein n=1 Tax=Sorangium sp. So ce321 TaxID=3133300 RepID=UPI003F62C4FD